MEAAAAVGGTRAAAADHGEAVGSARLVVAEVGVAIDTVGEAAETTPLTITAGAILQATHAVRAIAVRISKTIGI